MPGQSENDGKMDGNVAQQSSAQRQGAQPQPGHGELGQDKALVLEGRAVHEWFLHGQHQLRWTFDRLLTNQLDFKILIKI